MTGLILLGTGLYGSLNEGSVSLIVSFVGLNTAEGFESSQGSVVVLYGGPL